MDNEELDFEPADFEPILPPENKEEKVDNIFDNTQSANQESNLNNQIISDKQEIIDNSIGLENQTMYAQEEKQVKKEEKQKKLIIPSVKVLPVIAFVFVSVMGVYLFLNNVKADVINLIKIEEKQKTGYIDNKGEVIVKPKYLYGSDFYKGYAVVKNYNNLYGIINGKGSNKISFGNIFSATLYGDIYIVSKFTNEGLKMGLLDSNLNEITRFKYDNLTYSKSGIFLFTREDTMGIMNKSGKEIYSYKVDEIDDKDISVEVSNITSKSNDEYAKIKVNSSSTIINITTGKEAYKYTLDDIRVLDNNVFYIINEDGNNTYFVIKDDNVIYQTSEYKRIRIEDIDSNIALAIKDDASIDYINLLTKEKINSDGNVKYTYSDGIVLEEIYNFAINKLEYTVITPEKILSTFTDVKPVDSKYVNGYMKIKTSNDKYTFIDKNGRVITSKEYDDVSDFNQNGYAIVKLDNLYGVINTNGKEIIDINYESISFLDDNLFNKIQKYNNQKLFIFKSNDKYGIINSNKKEVVKPIYSEFNEVTTKYPFIKAIYNNEELLLNLDTFKDLSIKINDGLEIYENYILSSGTYYNYDGSPIYTIGG